MATVTPNFNWPVPTSTDLVKDGATAIEALGDSIDASLVDLKGGTTGQVLSKTSGTDMDFTWVTSDDANAIQNTIVDAKGDLIAATAADTPARLAVGTNGQVLTADSTAATGLAWSTVSVPTSLGYAAGKNAILNGDFSVNQRAFTSTTTNEAFGFDRWLIGSVNGTTTYTAQTFTPGTAPVAGYEGTNFARLATTGQGVNSLGVLIQRIENGRTFAGQTVTVSFWAKAASGTPQISTNFLRNYGTGGSPSSQEYTNTAVKTTLSTSWARYTVTLAIPSVSGKTFGTTANTSFLALYQFVSDSLTPGSGSLGAQNVTIDFWGVQVEAGSTATAFQTATGTIQGELAACQRYYFRSSGGQIGVAQSTVEVYVTVPNVMRAAPTVVTPTSAVILDRYGVGAYTQSSAAVVSSGTYVSSNAAAVLYTNFTGLTAGIPYVVRSDGGSVILSSEL